MPAPHVGFFVLACLLVCSLFVSWRRHRMPPPTPTPTNPKQKARQPTESATTTTPTTTIVTTTVSGNTYGPCDMSVMTVPQCLEILARLNITDHNRIYSEPQAPPQGDNFTTSGRNLWLYPLPGDPYLRAKAKFAVVTLISVPKEHHGFKAREPADTQVCVVAAHMYGVRHRAMISEDQADYIVLHDATVTREQRAALRRMGAIPVLLPPIFLPTRYLRHLTLAAQSIWLLKMYFPNLAYERVLFLDVDLFLQRDASEFLRRVHSEWRNEDLVYSMWADCEGLNSGFLVIKPSLESYLQMWNAVANFSFDKATGWNEIGPVRPTEGWRCACVYQRANCTLPWTFYSADTDQGLYFYVYTQLRRSARFIGLQKTQLAHERVPLALVHLPGTKPWYFEAQGVKMHKYRSCGFWPLWRRAKRTYPVPALCSSYLSHREGCKEDKPFRV